MKKIHLFFALLLIGSFHTSAQITWEKLFSNSSTDVFRSVQEVPAGGYVAAGYTADSTVSDTDAYVVRMTTSGDTIWTYRQNIGLSKKDLFYKVINTADGGFAMCGYTSSITGVSDDILFVKINSSGQMVWTKTWGGSGKDRAQDIIELGDGSYAITGYTTSSPALYYDAFLYHVDANGDSLWFKRYGTATYDDANSVRALSNGGYLLGGQSSNGANGFDQFLIRTNDSGDTLWTRRFGTTGTDNIEYIAVASDGFYLTGGTNGAGAGGDDGYLVKTDTSGNVLFTKTFGGSSPDDFHRVEITIDGGLILSGTTSSTGPLQPNMWLMRTNAAGDSLWSQAYGGDNHDHGYSGCETSDGGFILAGHSGSFGFYNEEGYIVKTDANGAISNRLTYTGVTSMVSPAVGVCGAASVQIKVIVRNFGNDTVPNVPVQCNITGALTQTLNATYNGAVIPQDADTLVFLTTINTSAGGTFNFTFITGNNNDVYPARNTFTTSITIDGNAGAPTVANVARCGDGTVTLNAVTSGSVYWFSVSSGGVSIGSGNSFTTPTLSTTTTYYAQTGLACPSTRTAANAIINALPADPTVTNGALCSPGAITLSAASASNIEWYDAASGGSQVATGTSYTTPTLSSTTTYYVQSVDGNNCISNRVPVVAAINTPPAAPTTADGVRCGTGTVTLTATSAANVVWYDAPTGGSLVGTGNSFTTPVISSNVTYYAESVDGNSCISGSRSAANAVVNSFATDPVLSSSNTCGPGVVTLTANSNDIVNWYDAASGGTLLATGLTFTTPFLTSNTTYYAQADNGGACQSSVVSVQAQVFSAPSVTLGPDTAVEIGDTLVLTASPAYPTYLWSTSDTTASISLTGGNATYCVTITDANGCTANDCVDVTFFVGVNEFDASTVFALYPNPANEKITIAFKQSSSAVIVELMDLSGQIVMTQNFKNVSNGSTNEISLNELASGIYLSKVTVDGKIFNQKLIVY